MRCSGVAILCRLELTGEDVIELGSLIVMKRVPK